MSKANDIKMFRPTCHVILLVKSHDDTKEE